MAADAERRSASCTGRRGRVVIGANEAAVHSLLPLIETLRGAASAGRTWRCAAFLRARWRRSCSIASLDFGVLTFQPPERGLHAIPLGHDELVLLAHPDHPLASRSGVTIEEVGRADRDRAQRSVAGARARPAPLRTPARSDQYPDLAAEPRRYQASGGNGVGVAVLPRRCALAEIAAGRLAAVKVPELASPRQIRLVFREAPSCRTPRRRFSRRHPKRSRLRTRRRKATVARCARSRRSDRAAVPWHPMCRRGTIPARGAGGDTGRTVAPKLNNHLVHIDRDVGPGMLRSIAACSSATSLGRRHHARHAKRDRVAEENLRKRLANHRPEPRRRMACGACSRDEPQPKFAFTNSTWRPQTRVAVAWMLTRGRHLADVVLEEMRLEAFEVNGTQEPRRE